MRRCHRSTVDAKIGVVVAVAGGDNTFYKNGEIPSDGTVAAAAHVDLHDTFTIGKVDNFFNGTIDDVAFYTMALSASDVGAIFAATGDLTLNSEAGVVVAGAANDATITGYANATIGSATTSTGIDTLTVANFAGAQTAIKLMDSALQTVNGARADLGALQSRFESVVANLQTNSENLTASRSRIQDADFASETASLSRGQILQQAGTAMLAQANAAPQNVLSLLR